MLEIEHVSIVNGGELEVDLVAPREYLVSVDSRYSSYERNTYSVLAFDEDEAIENCMEGKGEYVDGNCHHSEWEEDYWDDDVKVELEGYPDE
jgi:hypothetical protein